jgi:hypothetical protein
MIALGWWYLKAKRVQDCQESKVEMYKSIWGLVFKCNDSGIQFNLIQFSQEYSNQRNMRKKKDQTRTQDVTEFSLKISMSLRLSTSNNRGWAETLKNSFTLVEFGPLHKNGLSSLSVTRVTTHSKMWVTTHSKQEVSDNTLNKRWVLQLKKCEHYSSRNKLQEDHEGSSWENRKKLDWT